MLVLSRKQRKYRLNTMLELNMQIQIKRIYDPIAASDGKRILVDRLWPRGVSKEKAQLDLWLKNIAPSPQLRKAFNHQAEHWSEFQHHYYQELKNNPDVTELKKLADREVVTLLYAAKDPALNHALVLRNYLFSKKITN